jgi:hypothetical protein
MSDKEKKKYFNNLSLERVVVLRLVDEELLLPLDAQLMAVELLEPRS